MSKVVIIVAPQNFQPVEYSETLKALKNKGIEVVTSSTILNPTASNQETYQADILIDDIDSSDYDAIILIGGSGSSVYFHHSNLHRLVTEFTSQNKIIAAICAAPAILAYAGVLKDKNATCFPSHLNDLNSQGAHYIEQAIVEDDNIITANGPDAAADFGKLIALKI